MTDKKVLVVGELNVDIIYNNIEGKPTIGKEIIANSFDLTLGSSSAIFASNLSTLGTKVAFMGKIGDDEFGDVVKSSLINKKVNVDKIITADNVTTGSTIVLNYDMDRANITYPGAMEHLLANEITDEILGSHNHLHVSSIFLQQGLKKGIVDLFKRAKKLGLTTSMDPQWDPAEKWDLNLNELLPHTDVFLPNKKEFLFITGTDTIEEGLKKIKNCCNNVVIKDGENGAHLWNGTIISTEPAFLNTEVADCIGAGDSFNAGFINMFLKTENLPKCLTYGNIIGAINTTQPGGTTAFENIEKITNTAKEKFSFEIL